MGPSLPTPTPVGILAAVCLCFVLLSSAVLSLTPAWESNDEPDHVQNVETIVQGHIYRMTAGSGLESIQFPLYYILLAQYQKLMDQPYHPRDAQLGPIGGGQQHGNFNHNVPQDGRDQRFVDLLRVPSLVLGLLTVLLTYFAGRRISRDPWTPVVAAAIVAGVPKFVFVSGLINNDNLSNALGAAGLAAALTLVVAPAKSKPRREVLVGVLGLIAGGLMLTKVTGALLAPGLLLAVLMSATGRRERLRLISIFALAALVVCCGWSSSGIKSATEIRSHSAPCTAISARSSRVSSMFPGLSPSSSGRFQSASTAPSGMTRAGTSSPGSGSGTCRSAGAGSGRNRRSRSARRSASARASSKALWVCSVIALGGVRERLGRGRPNETPEEGRLAFIGAARQPLSSSDPGVRTRAARDTDAVRPADHRSPRSCNRNPVPRGHPLPVMAPARQSRCGLPRRPDGSACGVPG